MIAFMTTAELGIVATVVVAVAGFYFNSVNAKRDREARLAPGTDSAGERRRCGIQPLTGIPQERALP